MKAYEQAREEIALLLEEKRRMAEVAADDRRTALRERYPEFSAICAEKESYLEKILHAFTGDARSATARLEQLKQEHRALRCAEEAFLAEHGLAPDYLQPQYECRDCSDRGFLADGRMCACFRKELNAVRARESGLFSLFEKQTFSNFDDSALSQSMKDNMQHCKQYAQSFNPKSSENLLFVGGTGVGKTHLSSAIGRVVLEKGYSVVYESAMSALSAMETERFAEEKVQTQRLLSADLLILDDLGTELPGKGSVSFLYLLINSRLISHKPTLLSTNLSDRELEARYEERLFSRLTGEYEILIFDGEDRRGRE